MNDSLLETWKDGRVRMSRAKGAGELIPTWQQGQEQPRPHDITTYAEEGYSKNSLIYSCIRELSTSFASLKPQIVRADESVVKRHRALNLMARPNTYQDYEEFADLMCTQYEAAGNCYIEKVRQSANRDRRREFDGYPVQELQLIRPDYVTIQPGATRENDVFLVTIGGQVRRRIPRADMIHIHEPSLTNDFYGLSKIALLVREGSIDLKMSDFDLAFYTNAGVPMGLLNLKNTRSTPAQAEEIKGAFRKAYNGARHWFDLLVMNNDEAQYQQLGIPQSAMEGNNTRFHVESRICAVFGVPPIVVGARVGMSGGGTIFSYEDAQHALWAETMVPKARRFAGAFTAGLLSEFALVADSGAVFSYDFTQVRALQEDRSRKLREVVRLVITGAFSRDQALVAVGLPAIGGPDFYVRNGNQVRALITGDGTEELQPMTPPGEDSGEDTPNENNPLEGAAGVPAPPARKLVGINIQRDPDSKLASMFAPIYAETN